MVLFSKNDSFLLLVTSMLPLASTGGLRAAAASANDKALGPLVIAGAVPLRRLAPGGLRLAAPRGAALAATVGVVAGVHGGSAHLGPAAQPAGAASLADAHVLVVNVAHLAYRGLAVHVHHTHLAGRQPHLGVGLV